MALRFKRILFSLIPVLVVFLMIEIVTRILDPFPYEVSFDEMMVNLLHAQLPTISNAIGA